MSLLVEADLFPLLSSLAATLSGSIPVSELDPAALIKEVQTVLNNYRNTANTDGYYTGALDGVVGDRTRKAIASFKADHWLEFPEKFGRSTVLALLEVARGAHPISEQIIKLEQKPLVDAGTKTGRSMTLPTGAIVYANEFIVPGCFLTWGEFTANCSRPLEEKWLVANATNFARVFGEIREKYGSPIALTSGYRPPHINRAVGGATRSQHQFARAGDIYCLDGNMPRLLQVIKGVDGVTGIGLGGCRGFWHIDTRSGTDTPVVFGYGC